MKTKKLGTQGFEVSELGLGCMGMSEFYGVTNEQESIQVIHQAIKLGITHFDTADVYGWDENGMGANERLVGKALSTKRKDITVATKFGIVRSETEFYGNNGSPSHVKKACEESLKRLGTDYIDLYYLHRADPKIPIEETVTAMSELVKQGKVRYLGLSEVSSEQLEKAHAIHPITAVQTEYSLWSREPEQCILQTCRKLGVGFIPYSPLGRGFLTGKLRSRNDLQSGDWRLANPRFTQNAFNKNEIIVEKIEEMAKDKKCTPAQLALAWVCAQGEDIVPIPGTKRSTYLEENIQALEINLTEDDLRWLDSALPVAYGDKY